MPEFDLDWLISVDDHVLEPPDVWTSRLPRKYVDAGPRVVVDDGVEHWVCDNRRRPTTGLSAAIGSDRSTWSMDSMNNSRQLDTNPALSGEDKYKILRGNAERFFSFEAAAPPFARPRAAAAGGG